MRTALEINMECDLLSDFDDLVDLQVLEYLESRKKRFVHTDRKNDLDCMDNVDFRSCYHFDKNTAESLIRMLDSRISAPSEKNNALSSTEKFLIASKYFANGSFQLKIGDLAKVSQSSASRAVNDVARALAELRPNYIRLPQTELERQKVSQEFYESSGFPFVFGAIDCTHIPILNPGGNLAEIFRCRKGYFSLKMQTVSDASLNIRDIVVRWPGSTHDTTIFDNSRLKSVMENEVPSTYHLVGDNGYGCRSYLLTPFLEPSNEQQMKYNAAHKSARSVVERQCGVLTRRFACLSSKLRSSLQNSMTIVVACAVLHNIALQMNDTYEEIFELDNDDDSLPVTDDADGIRKRNILLSTVFN